MAKEKTASERPEREGAILDQSISDEMKSAYLDYAMSVITARALPDVRDGLKPVHRRILYAMHTMRLTAQSSPRKSATVVGEVLGKYHPHGDAAVYDAMVKLTQDFAMRYPLIIGQGNFGSIDGDSAAAMRYTEAKMSRMSAEMLRDLEKETVNWRPNYDGRLNEPTVLPAAVPNLLLNGTLGIAVGMATTVPPHNLTEVVDATLHLIDNTDATTDDLLKYIKGPDFPTGGVIFNKDDIRHAYANGKGGIVVRGEADIEEDKKGQSRIIITSLPFRVNKATLIEKMAELVHAKKLEGVRDLRDESTDEIRIVIELKSGAYPQKVLNYIYKHTELENKFHLNVVVLVDGVPQTLSLKGILEEFVVHRATVVRRRTEFDLRKAEEREHILAGLKKALDHIDEIIALIKKSKDTVSAHAGLMKTFTFSERQATAILEMRLQKLAGLERKKLEDELTEVRAFIKTLKELLASKTGILNVIKDELKEIREKFGDERRTKVVAGGVKNISTEDLVPEEESVLVFSAGGYVKRTNPNEYHAQRRGGVGVVDLNTKEEDFVTTLLTTSTHSDLLFFTDRGKVYQMKMYEVPEGRRATRGKSIMNFLSLAEDEHVTSILPMSKEVKERAAYLVMVTKDGVVKKVDAGSFHDVRRSGIISIKLGAGDALIGAHFVSKGDEVVLVTRKGQSIRFTENDVRAMGRSAGGVRGIKLSKGDMVIGAGIAHSNTKDQGLLVVAANGYGKQTTLDEYKVQKRGGSGIKTMNITAKTGELMSARVVTPETDEIVAMSKKGQVIRVALKEIPSLGRATQGVRIMKLRVGDALASLITF